MKPHPFKEPLKFGDSNQIASYRHMEAVKAARQSLSALPVDVMREALEQMNLVESAYVFIG